MVRQAAVNLHAPARTVRIAQGRSDDIDEGARAVDDSRSVQRISGNHASREARVCIDRQPGVIEQLVIVTQVSQFEKPGLERAAIIEQSGAGADDGAVVFEWTIKK